MGLWSADMLTYNNNIISLLYKVYKTFIISAVKRLIAINRIQNKSFCLHNMCVCYKYTHIQYFENIYMYIYIHINIIIIYKYNYINIHKSNIIIIYKYNIIYIIYKYT